jgi:magnesium-transporting ATPase (P-type)
MNNMVAPYLSAPSWVRWYHTVRLLRFPALAAAMMYRTSIAHASAAAGVSEGIFLAGMFVLPALIIASFEGSHELAARCSKPQRADAQPRAKASLSLLGILQIALAAIWVAAVILLLIFGASSTNLSAGDAILLLMSLFVMLWFLSKLIFVANVLSLRRSALTIHKGFDLLIGFLLLSLQMLFAVIPYGAMSHNSLLFAPRYARTLEVVLGARPKSIPPSGDHTETS